MDHSKCAVLAELEQPIAELVAQHEAARCNNLWMPAELIFPFGTERLAREAHAAELSDAAMHVPPALRAVWALHLVTEEGLPSYFQLLAQYLGLNSVFKKWIGRWTAEEDRHGQVLKGLALISGLIPDIEALEREQFHYLEAGFRPTWRDDPYRLLAYTAIQEQATKDSHANLSQQLKEVGASVFAVPLARISAEEHYHRRLYASVVKLLFVLDPDRMLCSLWEVVRSFAMPGISMRLYRGLADVAMRLGILTPGRIADILEQLFREWGIETITSLSNESTAAKLNLFEYLERLREQEGTLQKVRKKKREFTFPFLGNGPFVL